MTSDRTALRWTATDVLQDVRRKAQLPDTSVDHTDAVILREATDVLWSFAGWAVATAGEGRNLAQLDRSVATALLGSTYRAGSEVLLPPLAIADAVESVAFVDQNNHTTTRLQRIESTAEAYFDEIESEGTPVGYAMLSGRLRLYPRPTSGGLIRITYQRRHPELTPDSTAYAGTVASSSSTTTTYTLTQSVPITGLTVGDAVDVVRQHYPYPVIVASASVTIIAGSAITIDVPPAHFAGHDVVGARITRAGQSPYVSLPLELRACVNEKIAANLLRTIGDMAGSQACDGAATMELARIMQLLSPRARRDRPKAINPFSHLRSMRRS